jgi:hypothetical protein
MARDEIAGRERRSGGKFRGPTGREMTEERRRDRESAAGRAGGAGEFVRPEEEDVPKKTAGTDNDKKHLDEGGI